MDESERPDLTPPIRDVVVDVPGWQSMRARIPDTAQRRQLERQRGVREIVFGVQDGILTTLGIVTGVGVAEQERSAVLIGGFLALLAGALSMAVGQYLGAKSERDVVRAAIEMERREMADDPQGEYAELVAYYKLKGFSAAEAETVVTRLTQHPEIYLYEMMRDEFGIDPRVADRVDLRSPFVMGASYAIGALIPILAFVFPLALHAATILSPILAVIGLFAVGLYAGRLSGRNPLQRGFEVVAFGVVVFALSYLAGHYIPPLFGHAPISLGG